MIIQRCPRCGSSRIRRGYRPTPWWQAIFGRYNLLCNSCNWEFVGLAIPGTVPEQSSRKHKKKIAKHQQNQSEPAAKEVDSFAEASKPSASIGVDDSIGQNLVEADDISEQTDNSAALKSKSNASNEVSNISFIEASAEIKSDIDEMPESLKSDETFVNDSEAEKTEVTNSNKTIEPSTKRKVRTPVKRKK